MDAAGFETSLASDHPPEGVPPAVAALWWDAKGTWDRAHDLVAAHEGDAAADWVHAYLHRKEGDAGNAGYWYARAGRPAERGALDGERQAIVAVLLASGEGRR